MASLKDVAAAAGVSVSTVSRALGQSSHPVSPELRERIQHVASQLGYQPNPLGRALISLRLPLIGAIVHDIRNSYQCEIVRGVEDAANAAGYFVVVCNTDRDNARELAYIDLLVSYRATGIVFIASGVEDPEHNAALTLRLQEFTANGGHAVSTAPTRLLIPRVAPDNRAAAREAASHVLSLAEGPVLIIGHQDDKCATTERLAGFADAFSAHGLNFQDQVILWADDRLNTAQQLVELEIQRGTVFRAVLGSNDEMALGALLAMEARGIRVPDDVLIAGFGDMSASRLIRPQLTTVRVPTNTLGRFGAQMIIDAAEKRQMPPVNRVLPSQVIVRTSTVGTRAHNVEAVVSAPPLIARTTRDGKDRR